MLAGKNMTGISNQDKMQIHLLNTCEEVRQYCLYYEEDSEDFQVHV